MIPMNIVLHDMQEAINDVKDHDDRRNLQYDFDKLAEEFRRTYQARYKEGFEDGKLLGNDED